MTSLFSTSCRRCLQSAKYRGITQHKWNMPRYARTNLRKTQNENFAPDGNNREVLKKMSAIKAVVNPELIYENKDQELFSENQTSEDSVCEGIPPYVRLQDSDITMGKAMVAVNSKENKIKRKEIILEGNRLISEAIKHRISPKQVFFSRVEDAKKISWPATDFKMFKVPYKTIKLWSSLTTSPGVIGIFEVPDMDNKEANINSLPLIIVCDNIRDPGNLGSVLRVAAGVGCQRVLLTEGCVDLWNPKVLRSGAGAHFVLPVHRNCTWQKIEEYMDYESSVVLADSQSSSKESKIPVPLHQYHLVDYSGAWKTMSPIILVLGGETQGLSKEACELAESRGGVRLHIPLSNEVESLNASIALGVITFEIKRQYLEWTKNKEQSFEENAIETG